VGVVDGLRSKKDSQKAALWGVVINALFIIIIAIMLMGYPAAPFELLPNYYVINQIGASFLTVVYVLIVFLACVTNTISFSHALCGRYGQFLKIKSDTSRNLLICIIMLIYLGAVSWFGLDAIVRTGFTYLGYAALLTLLVPSILVGAYKLSKMAPEGN
jgi:uncharacterized membrane protein YkvI